MTTQYTVVILYEWEKYGDDIKKLIHKAQLKWNALKIKTETEDIFKKFKVDDEFNVTTNITITSGIWENKEKDKAIKIIKVSNIDNVVLIYKGESDKIYLEMMKLCKNIGCTIIKIVDDEIVFKDRINVQLLNKLKENNIIKKSNFRIKIEHYNTVTNKPYTEKFIKEWEKLMEESTLK